MIIYPAIDIRGGQAVRLKQGDYAQETVFDTDPAHVAKQWNDTGANWIHIVDLDAARTGERINAAAIRLLHEQVTASIQLGGGLRSMEDIDAVAALGIDRMVIGSAAVSNPALVQDALKKYGDRIAVGLDARNGMLATHGWTEQTSQSAMVAAQRFADMGVQHVIFTDIGRDGVLQGPNLEALAKLNELVHINVIASGGVSSLHDIRAIREIGVSGVIIGAALYHRRFTLTEALEMSREKLT